MASEYKSTGRQVEPAREWYFYTYRSTMWRVLPGEWMTDGLIAFAFDGKPQDIDRFRNAPFWRERFGSVTSEKSAICMDEILRGNRYQASYVPKQ